MKLRKLFSASQIGISQMSLFVLIETLLIFDKSFSKFHIWGPFYLYDLLLIALTIISTVELIRYKPKLLLWPINIIVGIGFIYLIYSFLIQHNPLNYTIRQFAIIVYIVSIYIIVNSFIDSKSNQFNIRFFILMGIASVLIQVAYHIFCFFTKEGFVNQLFTEFNYYSEMGFMSLFLFEAYILIFVKKWYKWLLNFFLLALLATLGHQGSVFMISSALIGVYFILHLNFYKKIGLILLGIVVVFAMFNLFPKYFLDYNSLWRYIYWKITLKDIFTHYYGILGHGFGVKFTTPEIIESMRTQIDSTFFEYKPDEQYLSPMHNSFITLAYHIGFVFMLLIFVPLKNMFAYIFNRNPSNATPEKDFLTLSMLGLIGWSSFHVILELPHSSALFWLVYFTTAYVFSQPKKNIA